tara:strand:- start:259 stop:480 length:222 start_codon:yes stop_codon:yes gene_type:complete
MSNPLLRIADTFSRTKYFGRTMRMVLMSSNHKPDFEVSVMPSPLPAVLIDWHGKPPVMTSKEKGSAVNVVMSS